MKYLIIYILFVLSATLIVVNRVTSFYISDYRLHFALLFIAASTFAITIGHLFKKLQTGKSILLTFIIVGALCFLKAFFTWGGDWKTETVVYRSLDNSHKTIDIQLRGDRFAFGYKKRLVEIYQLAPGMLWTTDIDTMALDPEKWQRVHEPARNMQTF